MDPCSEDEFEEDGGNDFGERVMALAQGLLDRLVLPACCWATWRGLRHYNIVRWCVVRATGLVHGHPLHQSYRFSVARMVASD
jgi:hypothetical protein